MMIFDMVDGTLNAGNNYSHWNKEVHLLHRNAQPYYMSSEDEFSTIVDAF